MNSSYAASGPFTGEIPVTMQAVFVLHPHDRD